MSSNHYYGLILAGGRGTRFWPRSRRARAKQVLKFFGDRSLIQQTVDRMRPVLPPERIWILTNSYLRDEIVAQLPEVPPEQIIAEPAARNTAPAIGLAAKIMHDRDPESIMGVFPSDHIILHPDRYVPLVESAFRVADEGRIVVLGIRPRWAETGYGYVEFPKDVDSAAPAEVLSFREKPGRELAEEYVAAGNYSWNAGMFFWRTSVILDELVRQKPAIMSLIDSLPKFGSPGFDSALADVFPNAENISIDYAVLERATNRMGLIADDIGWNDVGSWNAVYELLPRDADGNAGRGDAVVLDAAGTYFDVDGKLVALLGVKDLIVVDTPDALLIAHRSRAQDVGKIVARLEDGDLDALL